MPSDFRELNLDQERLKKCIEEYWKINNCQKCIYSINSLLRHRIEYSQDGCDVMVELIFLKNGTTTINAKLGKNHEKGEKLAAYLKNKLVSDPRKAITVTVKSIKQETFDSLMQFLQELKNEDSDLPEISVTNSAEDQTKKTIKLISKYHDSLTLTHYRSTDTLLIQGKPLYGYNQVTYFLAEFTDINGFLGIVYKGEENPNSISVDEDAIEVELRALLPNAYNNLGEIILNMLRTSYALKDISISLPDYTCYVFPALRALEGVMRRLLFINGGYSIEANNDNSFGGIFYKDVKMKFVVTNEFKQEIGDGKICNALEVCYNYFVQQRHTLFHTNDFTDSSRIITSKEQASEIIEKVVKIIDKAYEIAT